jgi:hypothetical protein
METKHTPATPLPWGEIRDDYEIAPAFYSNDNERRLADLEFAQHAANAYPKLIEALREMTNVAIKAIARTNSDNGIEVAEDSRALLRSLGEEA